MNSSRLIGVVLSVVGIGLAVIAGLWLAAQTSAGELQADGALLGAGIAFIPVALLVGAGIYLFLRGGAESKQESVMRTQRKLMDIVRSRGQVNISDLALELNVPAGEIKDLVHQLVGLQVFSGYINWDDGTLYSMQAQELRQLDKCKNCGGELKISGKGVVTCRFCGTEYFVG
ncbi:MAG: hypothetical protein KC547_07790 [Anaerolineae bacterium]|nr:hypothetical protein [Anaerolineae bacterium]MCA9911473.1 hypothetical protein [Anaerolineae bacterium]